MAKAGAFWEESGEAAQRRGVWKDVMEEGQVNWMEGVRKGTGLGRQLESRIASGFPDHSRITMVDAYIIN